MISCVRVVLVLIILTIPPLYTCNKHKNIRLRRAIDNQTESSIKNVTNQPIKHIIGGTNAAKGEFPWQGLLVWYNSSTGLRMICGATLLSSRYALTAAHCADDMETSRYFLQFGIIDIVNDNSGQVFINQIYVHPGYKTSNYTVNDIAILKLTNSVTFNSDIKPITLPVIDSNMIDGKGVVTGWGYYFRNGQIIDESSQILQKATVSFINQKACKNTWQYLNNNQLCAGDYLRGTANGDSGGPLQVLNNNTWYQVGITSTGAGTDRGLIYQNEYPGVYTRVSSYCSWIDTTTNGDVKCSTSILLINKMFLYTFILFIFLFYFIY